MAALTSQTIPVEDWAEVNDLYENNGWTDGYPIVPPTEERVAEMLESVLYPPEHIIGIEPVRARPLTAEKIAINAVMAGCVPPYFPIVCAAVEAVCDERYLLHGCSASTGGSAPLIIVNGPIRIETKMNSGRNVLANASRANTTIGRALRLILINVLECSPGGFDNSTLGHPGKYTLCIAEDEEDSPWLSVAEERGVPAGTPVSAVTVFACESPRQIMNEWTEDPEELLETYAAAMRNNMLEYSIWAGNYVIVIAKQHRDLLGAAGWDKRMIREFIHTRARVRRREWEGTGKRSLVVGRDPDQEFTALETPDDLIVVAAGGPSGGFGAIFPPWLGNRSRAVTKGIGVCVDC